MSETSLVEFTPAGLLAWLRGRGVSAEIVAPGVPMPTVPLAAAAIGVPLDRIVKTLLFEDRAGRHVRVIARGEDRIDGDLLAQLAGLDRPRLAKPDVVLAVTGWPAGGVAPVGLRVPVPTWLDAGVLAADVVWGGAGTHDTLLRIAPADILLVTGASIADLALEPSR
jgi:prolyl-tRNA editing enzyme YbaK/EbsC (Cys-tRNA(Pro) deacylase)